MADRIRDYSVNSARWLSLEDFDGEVWKDIPGYEGWYQVSNMGRIKSMDRSFTQKRICDSVERHIFTKGKVIKASYTYGLYLFCHLKKNGTSKAVKYHRIVCSVFHKNPDNLPQVNHKNEIKTDNRADNLEWCTPKYNRNYGTAPERLSKKLRNRADCSKPVYKFSLNGVLLKEYPSIKEAARDNNLKEANIVSVCNNGKSSSTGGFIWSFNNEPGNVLEKINRKAKNRCQYAERPVLMFSKEGKLINRFNSIVMASKSTGIHKDTITRCCKHEGYYHTAGGYKWEFE